MRNYLIYSSSAHLVVLLALLFAMARNPLQVKKNEAFFVDFVGPSSVVTMQKTAEAAAPEAVPQPRTKARPAPKADYLEAEDFSGGLPKPSVLSGNDKLIAQPKGKPAEEPSEDGNSTALVTDAQNFPYPWYIAQVREALWNAWTGKMPSGGNLHCVVKFTIKRDGSIKAVSVEKSSGNRLFDYAADNSVHSAAPFQALPDDFYEDTLTVHVEFKAGE